MSLADKIKTEILFWFHVSLTVFISTPDQLDKMTTSVGGVLVTTLIFADLFVALNLLLSIDAYLAKPSRAMWRTMLIYLMGIIMYTLFIVMFFLQAKTYWNGMDTITVILVVIGVSATIHYKVKNKLPLGHQDVKKFLAISFRVAPQLLLAWNIVMDGTASGYSMGFILSFQILVASRIWQIELTIKEAPHDKHRRALQLTETAGWLSWMFVTVAWAAN